MTKSFRDDVNRHTGTEQQGGVDMPEVVQPSMRKRLRWSGKFLPHATIEDLPVILAMRAEASAWLAERGIDQWSVAWPTPEAQSERIRAGETRMIRTETGETAGTVALDLFSDPQLWTPEEQAEPAMYLHRLIVRRKYAGLGTDIVDWACDRAGQLGNRWVRIDVWTDNVGLHRYYEKRGFKHVRTLDLAHYPSGALFQRPATDWRGRETAPVLTGKPQTLPTRRSRFEPFERALWPVLSEPSI